MVLAVRFAASLLAFALVVLCAHPSRAQDAADTGNSDRSSAPPAAAQQPRTNAFGAGLELYVDSGTQSIRRVNSGGGDLIEGDTDVSNDGMLLGANVGLAFSLLHELEPRIWFGGSLRLLGAYAYKPDRDGADAIELGQLLELAPELQYLLPITDQLGVAFSAELGLALLFPSGDLDRRIQTLDAQGFNVTGLPRLGIVGGPQIGLRYAYNAWLAARADIGYLWEKLFLVDASAESGGLRGEESWDVSWTRLRLHVGAELLF